MSAESQRYERGAKVLGIENPDKGLVHLIFSRGNDLEIYNRLLELKRLQVFHSRLKTICQPAGLTPKDALEIVRSYVEF